MLEEWEKEIKVNTSEDHKQELETSRPY